MTRHAEQDAIDQKTFDQLVSASDDLDEGIREEARFILFTAGRLGMRAGEISHIEPSWIDWKRSRINIPMYEPCTRGKDGGRCGYCKKRARSRVKHDDTGLSFEDALEERWLPKTETSARAIPFGFDKEIEKEIELFFWEYDRYNHSRQSVNRRVTAAAEAAGIDPKTIYPHAIRATAATYHSYNGLSTAALKSMFGWKKLDVAEKYIRKSGEATAEALNETYK